jgi:single-strand DNA-binding protein
MSIANLSIVGNLVKAPQQTQFASGKVKTTMFVAVNNPMRKTKDGNSTADFYKVETWGKLAELAASKLDKGNQVAANGRLSMETWVDKQGRERVTPTISVYDFAFPPKPRTDQQPFNPRVVAEQPFESSVDEDGAVIKHVFAATSTGGDDPVTTANDNAMEIAAPVAATAADDDEEFDQSELEEQQEQQDNSDDDFGMPNTSTRPAPTRDGRPSPR